jgi:hypothetical protein
MLAKPSGRPLVLPVYAPQTSEDDMDKATDHRKIPEHNPMTEGEKAATPKDPQKRKVDKALDDTIDDSFPASDPPAIGYPDKKRPKEKQN